MNTPTGRSDFGERPISDFASDRLERRAFVERIADGLITEDGKAARGLVIGVTGPWGSGKSSILNLVDQEIRRRAPDAVVVRFDPWMISGQHDLILSFLRETIRTIAAEPTRAKVAKKLIDGLSAYATHLAPLMNLVAKGSGDAAKGLLQGLNAKVHGDQSLSGQRKRLEELIVGLRTPVVVLIDELDRIEDDEVRSIAQLVRAVADFPGISYLLAYDPRRVARALGRGNDEHGRAYLEKIVQLPLALPMALPEELHRMLDTELHAVLFKLKKPELRASLRYEDIAEAITPKLASTPRDIKRLVGIFHPLAAMLKDEVDLVDLLGFSALMAKAPLTIERIAARPDLVLDHPLTFDETIRRLDLAGGRTPNGDDAVVLEPEAAPLVSRLFPALVGRQYAQARHPNAISGAQGLLTVLRLGLLPMNTASDEAIALLAEGPEVVAERFAEALKGDKLAELMHGLTGVYTHRFSNNDLGFWRGAVRFLNRTDLSPEDRYLRLPNLASNLAAMLEAAAARRPDANGKANRILNELRADDLMLVPLWLSHHRAIHGLGPNGWVTNKAEGGDWFLNPGATVSLLNTVMDNWRNAIVGGRFLDRLNTLEPLQILVGMGAWNDECKKALAKALADQVGAMAILIYLPNANVSAAFINTLIGAQKFLDAAQARLSQDGLDSFEQTALQRAVDHLTDAVALLPEPQASTTFHPPNP